jgi:hypothetical protein
MSGWIMELSWRVGRESIRSATAARTVTKPSRVTSSEMTIAAAPSAHHSPAPMPRIPTIAAPAVSQLARFILASAYSTLSCS